MHDRGRWLLNAVCSFVLESHFTLKSGLVWSGIPQKEHSLKSHSLQKWSKQFSSINFELLQAGHISTPNHGALVFIYNESLLTYFGSGKLFNTTTLVAQARSICHRSHL